MKVIDLLNKIANGEEVPTKIKYDNLVYEYNEQYDYKNELQINYYSVDNGTDFFNNVFCYSLNDEVEIIEDTSMVSIPEKEYLQWLNFKNILNCSCEDKPKENKIEKLAIYDDSINWCCNGRAITDTEKDIMDKINELINKVNEMSDDNDR